MTDAEHECPNCDRAFTTRSGLGQHHSTAHGESITEYESRQPTPEEDLRCDECQRAFESKQGLAVHKSRYCSSEKPPWKDRDTLYQRYVEGGESQTQLAESWDIDPSTVNYWLEEYGIEKHPLPEDRTPDELDDPEVVYELYVEKEWPATDIADHFDVTHGTVYRRLERFDIPTREIADYHDRVECECAYCGATLERIPSRAEKHDKQFCTDKPCQADWLSENVVGADHPDYNSVEVECSGCGSPLTRQRSQFEQYDNFYCNDGCQGADISGTPNRGELQPDGRTVLVNCAACGDELHRSVSEVNNSERSFCTRDCQGGWLSENRVGEDHPRFNSSWVTCENCGADLLRSESRLAGITSAYCDQECQGEDISGTPTRGELQPDGRTVVVDCEWCGVELERSVNRVNTTEASFCDDGCFPNWVSENNSGSDNPIFASEWVACDYCGEDILRSRSRLARYDHQFCDRECQSAFRADNPVRGTLQPDGHTVTVDCEWCSTTLHRPVHRVNTTEFSFCEGTDCRRNWRSEINTGSDNPFWRGGGGTRDAATRLLGTESWDKTRKRTREQAGHTCEMCHAPREDIGRELDAHHIIPVLSGGCNADELLMALCPSCHKKAEHYTRQFAEPLLVDWTDDELPDGRSRHRDDPDATGIQPTLSAFAE